MKKCIDNYPDYKDPRKREAIIAQNVVTSARIEGIDITVEELAEARKRYGHLVKANISEGQNQSK